MNSDAFRLRIAACFGFLAVALGAFGAHGLREGWQAALSVAEAAKRLEVWQTAVFYHLTHAIGLVVLALTGRYVWAWRCWVVGIILFSGSLYLLGLTGIKWLGAVTPLGGVAFLVGWGMLVMRPKATA